jgi:rubrerythrin
MFGRRAPATQAGSPPLPADYFGTAAALEAESVTAFRTLARELTAHGAPRRLRADARRAAREEARHTRAMSALDRNPGARRVSIPRCPSEVRSLEAIACDNAAEGCVRETYGAVLARLQAEQAPDPSLRVTLRSIAREEACHANFSWTLARWIDGRLRPAERDRLRQSREKAVRRLRSSIESLPATPSTLGLPSRAQALRIFEALDRALWSVRDTALTYEMRVR